MKNSMLLLLLFSFVFSIESSDRGLQIFKERRDQKLADASSERERVEAHLFYEMGLLRIFDPCENFGRTKRIASWLVDLDPDSSDEYKLEFKKRIANAPRVQLQKTWAGIDVFALADPRFEIELKSIKDQIKQERIAAQIKAEEATSRRSSYGFLWRCLFGKSKSD